MTDSNGGSGVRRVKVDGEWKSKTVVVKGRETQGGLSRRRRNVRRETMVRGVCAVWRGGWQGGTAGGGGKWEGSSPVRVRDHGSAVL